MKGVSDLVAVIVLIGITLIVAALVATFVQTTAARQITSASECTQAKGFIDRAAYDSGVDKLTLYISNNGRIDLTFNTFVGFLNGSAQSGGQVSVNAGQIVSHEISGVAVNIRDVSIQSVQCIVVDVLEGRLISGLP